MEMPAIVIGGDDEVFQRRRRQAVARLELALLKRHDRIVESYHGLKTRTDLSPDQIEAWRQQRRSEYRRVAGVSIEQRDALVAGLEHIAETGEASVEELQEKLRQDYAKRFSSVAGFGGTDGELVP